MFLFLFYYRVYFHFSRCSRRRSSIVVIIMYWCYFSLFFSVFVFIRVLVRILVLPRWLCGSINQQRRRAAAFFVGLVADAGAGAGGVATCVPVASRERVDGPAPVVGVLWRSLAVAVRARGTARRHHSPPAGARRGPQRARGQVGAVVRPVWCGWCDCRHSFGF